MRKFLKNIFFFSIGLWCIATVVDIIISDRFSSTDSWDNKVWRQMLNSEMDNDFLILGSSRAALQYDPRIIDSILGTNSYNLGRDGKRIDIQYLVYQIYKKYGNNRPETVILDFFDASLALSDPYNSVLFYPYLWEPDIWNCIKQTQHVKAYWRFVPLVRYYSQWGLVNNYIHYKHPMYKGYRKNDWTWDGSEFDRIERIGFAREDTAIVLLDKLLADCTSDGINVVLVHSPIYSKYWDKFPDSADMWNLYREFADKYDIPLLNYTNDPMCDDTSYFYNARHLNRVGAEMFTRKLAHDLDSMGYSNK